MHISCSHENNTGMSIYIYTHFPFPNQKSKRKITRMYLQVKDFLVKYTFPFLTCIWLQAMEENRIWSRCFMKIQINFGYIFPSKYEEVKAMRVKIFMNFLVLT
jgi:hypothetical protein